MVIIIVMDDEGIKIRKKNDAEMMIFNIVISLEIFRRGNKN